MAIVHVRALEEARRFQEHLCREVGCPGNVLMTELTPGLSVHSGAGLVGAAYVISETP